MRRLLVLPIVLLPICAFAQTQPPPGSGMGQGYGGDRAITRDEYVQRAATAAGRRFDQIDVSHTGTITRSQIRAWRAQHAGNGGQPGYPQNGGTMPQ